MLWELRWLDVAPSTTHFELALVEDRIAALVAAVQRHDHDRQRVTRELTELFTTTFGPWAELWLWPASSGGPTRHFCCASHSIVPERESDRAPTVRRICDALIDARAFTEECERVFAEVHALHLDPVAAMERAAPRLLELVLARNPGEDAWYSTYERVMSWFGETILDDAAAIHERVEQTIQGHFRSWELPSDEVRRGAVEALVGDALVVTNREPIDGTAAWLAIRETAFRNVPVAAPPPRSDADGHARYIEERDRARDPERAERMASALALCRDAARHQLPLAFDLLAEWQAVVLGESQPVAFRTRDAFAKAGRERYPIGPITQARFERALVDANDAALPLPMRAARAYLDICFFHPFRDGNARAARLALDHVLARAGLQLHDARGVFTLSRAAGDARGAWSLAAAIARLAGPR